MLRDGFDQRKLIARNGWIGADDNYRCVDVRDKIVSGGRIAGEHRAEPWCVDKTHARRKQRAGKKDFHARYRFRILRVLVFGDELIQLVQRDSGPVLGLKAYPRPAVVAMANDGRHGGDRHDAHGKNRSTHQGVDQGRFAPLELTSASDIKPAFRNPLGYGSSIA